VLGSKDHSVRGNDLGFVLQDEHNCPSRRNDCERLVGTVEDKGSSHLACRFLREAAGQGRV
jgi:hypothetical protein